MVHLDCDTRAVPASCLLTTAHEPKTSQKCKIRTQNQKNHKLLECFCKNEKIKIFGPGDVGGDIFRACTSFFSKGFARLPFKNEVEIAAVEDRTGGIGHHAVPKVRSGPAVILEPAGASQRRAETLEASKLRF